MKRLHAAALTCAPLLLLSSLPAMASQIFVTNEKDNTVTVVDSNSLEAVKTIPVGRRPRGIVISPDHKEVFVCLGDMTTSR
jgi:YVTN family beta-propeller protein